MSAFWDGVAQRHGLLTTAQGIAEFKRSGFYRRVRSGQFELVHRGVWRVAGTRASPQQRLSGLSLALRAVAGFRSTLALAGVPGQTLTRPELLRRGSGPASRDLARDLGPGVRVICHRTNYLPDGHLTVIDGIASTTIARALCDVSAVMSLDRLPKVVDSSKRLGLITYEELATCREELRARGRRRTTYLDAVLADRIEGWVVGDSPPENVVTKWLVDAGYEPRPQLWVVANDRRRQIDVALADERIACEYQGLAAHATASAVVNDSERITDLQLAGWFVVLVTKKTTREEFLRNVRQAIAIQRRSA
jgi:hypothetical protein